VRGFKTTVHLENEAFLGVNRSFETLQATFSNGPVPKLAPAARYCVDLSHESVRGVTRGERDSRKED
jgi:hypothetical protein